MNFASRVVSKISSQRIQVSRLCRPNLGQWFSSTTSELEDFAQFESYENRRNDHPEYERKIFTQSYLEKKIQNGKQYANSEWDEILQKALELPNYSSNINKVSINGVIMNLCLQEKNLALAVRFLNYLEEKGEELNNGTLSVFMKLCYSCVPDATEEVTLKYFDILKKRLPVMDATTAENCILAISSTSRWKECQQLLEFVKLSDSIGRNLYTVVVSAAFKNHQPKLGWAWLHQAAAEGKTVRSDAYSAWLEYCAENKPTLANAETLLKFVSELNIPLDDIAADDLKQYFESVIKPAWKVERTTVRANGICMACRRKLPTIFITQSEFQKLNEHFLEKVVLGRDVFTKSTPEEIDRFQQFIEKSLPYDVVIDGLNVAFSAGTKSNVQPIDLLLDVVDYFLERDMKIAIIGRIHMLKWHKHKLDFLQRNTKIFLAQNISQDDPFLLYAAMKGGPDTYFVSRDFMRGHKHKLQDIEMQKLFRRWQLARQYSVFGSKVKRKALINPPTSFLPFAQKTGDSWHVPFSDSNSDAAAPMFTTPKDWLCMKK